MDAKYAAVAKEIEAVLTSQPGYDDGHLGPLFVRLAWHASGTFCERTQTGGSEGGTMRFFPEASDPANKGLEHARSLLEPIKSQYPWLSYGDLWTLAGVVAVHAMHGPLIEWRPGRVDRHHASDCPPQGRLPDATLDAQHLRHVFHRMGFSDRDIVALNGAHTLGRCHRDRSGFIGPWTYTPTRFSNQFFILLLREEWTPVQKYPEGPLQYENSKSGGDLMMLPTDMCLLQDVEFRKWVQAYAADKQLFFRDFSNAFSKLLHLGVKNPRAVVQVCPMKSTI